MAISVDMQHVHLIGIAGTGMASLAGLFRAAGWNVTGSDQAIYPPMSTMLESLQIPVASGFAAEHLSPRPDLVVIGNVCTKENPESSAAIAAGIPYCSMPAALGKYFCDGRIPLVIAGTHGKTTSSSLAAWLLQSANLAPSFLVGGIPINFGVNFQLGTGKHFVIEGDEYDTAFFEKTPKIWHYPAKAAMLGPVEFDHADIYADLAAVLHAFAGFLDRLPTDAILTACADSANVRGLLSHAKCRVITYGVTPESHAQVTARDVTMGPDGTRFTYVDGTTTITMHSPMVGQHNLQNTLGVIALLRALGVDDAALTQGLSAFAGIKRRQEVVGEARDVIVIDDFAHHPTAIKATLEALRCKYPDRRMIVAYEPRSNTSGRKIFHNAYLDAFAGVNKVLLGGVHKLDRIPPAERLDVEQLAHDLMHRGVESYAIPRTEFLLEFLVRGAEPHDVIVVMSNGSFDNLIANLLPKLERKRIVRLD